MKRDLIIRGNICHTPSPALLEIRENRFLVCEGGVCAGIFEEIPARFADFEVIDASDMLVIPGMVDLHIHAPQFAVRGTGLDQELLEWLNNCAFPEEARYGDLSYARKAYGIFADRLSRSATTRAVVFGTLHREATLCLMDLMEQTGLVSFVGKVNMDMSTHPELIEKSASEAAQETRRFVREAKERGYRRTRPIITPRFIPSCTGELLEELGKICREEGLPVQSHLSENPDEVELVASLEPEAAFYGDAYDCYGLFGRGIPTVMAHCVYSTEAEAERIRDNGVWVAHCPTSNINLASGIAPVRKYLEMGIRCGLGSDVSGGTSESMFLTVTQAVQVSNLYWRCIDRTKKALSFAESFYLATKGGGSFFGKVGSFEEGYEFDALILDDSIEPAPRPLGVSDRLSRAFFLGLDRGGIRRKFAAGEEITAVAS